MKKTESGCEGGSEVPANGPRVLLRRVAWSSSLSRSGTPHLREALPESWPYPGLWQDALGREVVFQASRGAMAARLAAHITPGPKYLFLDLGNGIRRSDQTSGKPGVQHGKIIEMVPCSEGFGR